MGLGLAKYYDFSGVGQLAGSAASIGYAASAPEAPTTPQALHGDLDTIDAATKAKGAPGGAITADEVKEALTKDGTLQHSDGSPLRDGELALLTEWANQSPEVRAQSLGHYSEAYLTAARDHQAGQQRTEAVGRALQSAGQAAGSALTASYANDRRDDDTHDIVDKAERRYFARPH